MLLVSGTLVLVLYVLPQRYVLSSGFREGTLALPNPTTPFQLSDRLLVPALPPIPTGGPIVRGPAEVFWDEVMPLLDAGRFEAAIPLFARYLGEYPGDLDVRREYAITLAKAGYGGRAIPVMRGLLEVQDDPDLRLILARTLRDQNRVPEAATQYRLLSEASPRDVDLSLEWARALAWAEDYVGAERVLVAALRVTPTSVALRAELARVHYFAGRLEEANAILTAMTDAELATVGATGLRDDVVFELTPPAVPPDEAVPPVEPPLPSALERAVAAREAGDFDEAASFFRAALAESPDDATVWQAYADFLQYSREDFAGALEALKRVEELGAGGSADIQYRMALLEVWTDRPDGARERLEALLSLLDEPVGDRPRVVAKADVLTLLGDLERWDARRLPAVRRYEDALAEDPSHVRAEEGLAIIRAEVDRQMVETERPGIGGSARSLADTDDYRRYDVTGDWSGIHENWVWSTRAGNRWVEGFDLAGVGADRQGLVADFEGARWWRWGTVRTGAHMGFQSVRSSAVDVSGGLSARLLGGSGSRTDVVVEHAPAYDVVNTLQSSAANVQYERLSIAHSRPLGERWSLAATAEALSLDHRDLPAEDRNLRVAGGLSLGRLVTRGLTVGVATRALSYTNAAPAPAARSLYWDPKTNVVVGPYAQLRQPLGAWWEMNARVNPGIAYIDERGAAGSDVVPDLSGRLGFVREGVKYRTSVEFFYGQGRFTGYRSYGVDLSFSARGWFGRAGNPGGEE